MAVSKVRNGLIASNIAEVVNNKVIRSCACFVFIPDGVSYYIYKGVKYTKKAFEEKYPIQLRPFTDKGRNCDRTKNWVFGDKSY